MIKYYLPHITFFTVFFVASLPVLYYIRRKNPDPRFRPNFGEMSMITLFALFICAGMGFGLGTLFKPENDGSAFKKKPDAGAGWSASTPDSDSNDRRSSRKKDKDKDAPRRLSDPN